MVADQPLAGAAAGGYNRISGQDVDVYITSSSVSKTRSPDVLRCATTVGEFYVSDHETGSMVKDLACRPPLKPSRGLRVMGNRTKTSEEEKTLVTL